LKSAGETIKGVVFCGLPDFPPLLGGGLEPGFTVLFSAIFHGIALEIAVSVENSGR